MKTPAIGDWATLCCHLDLQQITNQERLDDIIDGLEDEIPWRVWATKEEALSEISKGWPEGSQERQECETLSRQAKTCQNTQSSKPYPAL
jgi:hypothetical protein